MTDDPTLVRNQPALTTDTGNSWLIVGGLFTAISLGVLIAMMSLEPAGVALTAAIIVAALYLSMVVARLTVLRGRLRLTLMACGMLAIAATALTATLIVATSAV